MDRAAPGETTVGSTYMVRTVASSLAEALNFVFRASPSADVSPSYEANVFACSIGTDAQLVTKDTARIGKKVRPINTYGGLPEAVTLREFDISVSCHFCEATTDAVMVPDGSDGMVVNTGLSFQSEPVTIFAYPRL
ncbi:hypothetical protein AGR13a_Lc100194 [Agrobacterium genomosp. 13 str. CFBP 6927]|uniref:Uncharacterized protein n=1 Tax=Agrobacterium genomosp. 13 str. CFBP 6927 TaxID=1183428 RepID=A0ABP2BMS3_9HYPH|nr:hypothetical protein AGR13a_Lc100194 [Agrobacterium genomosp. 13 str. CFBP 6927]